MSRLIERLDQAIAAAGHPYARECLKAERAAALARHGQLDEARFALKGLRSQVSRYRQPGLAAWIQFTTGMLEHFSALSSSAVLPFEQAVRLAAQAGDVRLQAQCQAWLAQLHFNGGNYAAMSASLDMARQLAAADDHGTHARVELLLACNLQLIGREAQATRHFQAAHRHAVADGDISMVSVMVYNRCYLQANMLALADAFGERLDPEAVRRVLTEAESCDHLFRGIGNVALGVLVPMSRARLCVALQRWGEALVELDASLQPVRGACVERSVAHLLTLRAWCQWHLGRQAASADDARAAAAIADDQPDLDDRAAAHARLAALAACRGEPELAAEHRQRAEAALHLYRHQQERLAGFMARVVDLGAAL
jgi:hypothetical protein